jgi:two-component sensor histidine kinase
MVHESLYRKKDLSKINLSNYLSSLCKEIIHVHPLHGKVKLEEDIDQIETDITKAVPLGLIVNECITNSMKHAFQKKDVAPVIFISLKHQFGNVVLKIGDNGIGFDEKTVKKDSLGLSLINSLTEQLDGTTHFANSSNGSNIKITFPA